MLEQSISKINLYNTVLLMMSSGNFSSIDMLSVVKTIIDKCLELKIFFLI